MGHPHVHYTSILCVDRIAQATCRILRGDIVKACQSSSLGLCSCKHDDTIALFSSYSCLYSTTESKEKHLCTASITGGATEVKSAHLNMV